METLSRTLQTLLRSKTRTRILWHFYENLDSKVGLRELSRIVKLQVHAVGRELSFLTKAQLLKEEKTPSKNFYSISQEHSFFLPLLNMFHQSNGVGAILLNNLAHFEGADYMLLTSHFLFKIPKTTHDVDLLIVGTPKIDRVMVYMDNLDALLNREIMYTVMPLADFTQRKQQPDVYIWNILSKPFVLLKGDPKKVLTVFG